MLWKADALVSHWQKLVKATFWERQGCYVSKHTFGTLRGRCNYCIENLMIHVKWISPKNLS